MRDFTSNETGEIKGRRVDLNNQTFYNKDIHWKAEDFSAKRARRFQGSKEENM